jgi:hypothetical protein
MGLKELKEGAFVERVSETWFSKVEKIIDRKRDHALVLLDTDCGKRLAHMELENGVWVVFCRALYDCSSFTTEDISGVLYSL